MTGRPPGPGAGLFLSFEGIEGCGKTTQVLLLREWVAAQGREITIVREPGGTDLSERIRDLLLQSGGDPVDEWAELCLYEASRAQLLKEVIRPALSRGAVVVADRFADASVAYQGAGRGLGVEPVRRVNRLVTRGLQPRRTYLLDLDPATGLQRVRLRSSGALDRLESEPLSFHGKVRDCYVQMAAREPDRFRILDATLPVDRLAARIREDLRGILRVTS